jgi:hypothetical protein
MSTITVEVVDEQVDSIIRQELSWHLKIFEEDLAAREDGSGMAIFDTDRKKDIKAIKKHIKAFKLTLDYFGGKTDEQDVT